MAVNEVVVNGVTELSLVEDTVTEDSLLEGVTAHDASGNQITGKLYGVPVDTELDVESANAIQNKAVATALNNKADKTEIPATLPANGGNADTVDGKRASDFLQALGNITSGSIKDIALSCNPVGATAFISTAVTDMPIDNLYWFVYITGGGTGHRCVTAIHIGTGKTYQMTYNNGYSTWSDWVCTGGEIYTGALPTATGSAQTVTLGAQPKFVLLYGSTQADGSYPWLAKSASGGHANITITSTGFTFTHVSDNYPTQYYVAFA